MFEHSRRHIIDNMKSFNSVNLNNHHHHHNSRFSSSSHKNTLNIIHNGSSKFSRDQHNLISNFSSTSSVQSKDQGR